MEELGVEIELYPLLQVRAGIAHPEAVRWIERAHCLPFLSLGILRAQWHFIRSDASAYFKVWAEVLRGTWGSINFFLGAIAIFPKAVRFAYEMSNQKIAHVHAQFANHPAVAALIIHRLTGIPYSFTARGTDIQIERRMLKRKIEAAEFAIAVSAFNKKIMVDESGPDARGKVHVIYGGVDVDRLSPAPRTRPAGPFRILSVARFEEVKGHAYLVEACQLLRERGVAFECRLIGEGPLFSTVEQLIARAGLCQEVRLLGPRTYPEVIHELRQADVVALPTTPTASGKREGIPNVLKEAMACGLPVVATSVGGIPELVDHNKTGILVPPMSAIALADALQRLGDDPILRRQLGQSGREKVVRDFNIRVSTTNRAKLFLRNAGECFLSLECDEQSKPQVITQHSV